jgi:hypothetical protein
MTKAYENGFDDIITLLVKHKIGMVTVHLKEQRLIPLAVSKNNAILLKMLINGPNTDASVREHEAYRYAFKHDHVDVLVVLKSWYAAHNIPLPV